MKIFRKRKGLRIRLAALLMAFLICFSSVAVCKMKADAAGLAAALTVVGAAAGAAATDASLACTAAVCIMLIEAWNFDVYVSEQAAEEGKSKSDYIKDKITSFIESTGKTLQDGFFWLLDGCVWLYDGVVQLNAQASARWRDFFEYLFGIENIYSNVSEVPKFASCTIDGITFHLLGYDYDTAMKIIRDHNDVRIINNGRISDNIYALLTYDSSTSGDKYRFFCFTDSDKIDSYSYVIGWINYANNYSYNERLSQEINGIHYDFIPGGWGLQSYDYILNYATENELKEWIKGISVENIIMNSIDSALVGDSAALADDSIYSGMDSIADGHAVVIDPGLIGAVDVPDNPSDVIEIPVDEYADIIIGAFDGDDVVDLPTVGEVDLPADIDVPDVKIDELDDDPAHVVDLPGTTTDTGDNTDVVDDPIVAEDVAGITDPVEDILNWGLSYISPATGILSKFPFSIPYDLYMIVNALSGEAAVDAINADPKELTINNDLAPPDTTYEAASTSALSWHFTFTIPYGNTQTVIPLDIDLSDYEWVFRIIRYFTGILWLVGLLSWTRKESS